MQKSRSVIYQPGVTPANFFLRSERQVDSERKCGPPGENGPVCCRIESEIDSQHAHSGTHSDVLDERRETLDPGVPGSVVERDERTSHNRKLNLLDGNHVIGIEE